MFSFLMNYSFVYVIGTVINPRLMLKKMKNVLVDSRLLSGFSIL